MTAERVPISLRFILPVSPLRLYEARLVKHHHIHPRSRASDRKIPVRLSPRDRQPRGHYPVMNWITYILTAWLALNVAIVVWLCPIKR